nr:MAG TPA: hypothetical protein [Caudoviricetes sp.]
MFLFFIFLFFIAENAFNKRLFSYLWTGHISLIDSLQ